MKFSTLPSVVGVSGADECNGASLAVATTSPTAVTDTSSNTTTTNNTHIGNDRPKKARIALFTVRRFAIEHAVAAIASRPDAELACVLTCPGPQSRRSNAHIEVLDALHQAGLPNVDVICSNKKSKWAELVALYDANLVLCSGFPWLIPESVLNDPRLSLGVINFHNSILPHFMGPNAFGWQIVSNQNHVGYTVHRMSAEFDTGPILFTERVPLDVNEDYQDLQKNYMSAVYTGMVHKAIAMALDCHPGFPQVGTPSCAPKFAPDFRWIDFSRPALEAHNKVRAYIGVRDHARGALAKMLDSSGSGSGNVVLCFTKTRYHAPPIKLDGPSLLLLEQQENRNAALIGGGVVVDDVPSVDDTTGSSSDEAMSTTTASTDDLEHHESHGSFSSPNSPTTAKKETFQSSAMTMSAAAIPPGTILAGRSDDDSTSFFIQCGDTSLEVLQWHTVRMEDVDNNGN